MSYPKKVPAVLIDSEHIVLLEEAGFGVDIIGLGFRIDDNESSFGRYVKGTVCLLYTSPRYKEPKASMWNCPYHNSRMGFEIDTRLK